MNLLGLREPHLYHSTSLSALNDKLIAQAQQLDCRVTCQQSNAENELIDFVHSAKSQNVVALIVNAGAYAHTSIALRDALLAVQLPFIEVHITNTYAREQFRQHSYLSDIAAGVIIGCGPLGYELALTAMIKILNNTQE